MIIGIDIRLISKKRTGDEAVVFNLVKNFAQINTNHTFRLFMDIADEKIIKKIKNELGIIEKNNFEIISLPTKNKFVWNFWTLPMYLRKNPVDVYHTQYITPFFVSRKINPHTKDDKNWFWRNSLVLFLEKKYIIWHNKHFGVGVKIVTIVHDISFNFFPQFINFFDLLFLKTLIPLSLKRADKIVGVSQFTRDEIIKYYKISSDKVDYIYNAVGDEFSKTVITEDQIKFVREKYKLPEKFILYLGTLQPRKNISHLIAAFARIKERLGGTKLVICGNLEAHNSDTKIKKSITEYKLDNDVVFPGFIAEQDKVAVFASANVFVFPSLYEGFGIPPLEAMSQKVPVLCSNIPSLKEITEKSALFFDLDNLDDFSEKLYNISIDNNLRSELIRAGLQRVSFFSWRKSATRMLAIYEALLHN